jgi:hypothetical protein
LFISEQKLKNQTIWEKYKAKVVDIMGNHMEEDAGTQMSSVLIITGRYLDISGNSLCKTISFNRTFGPNPFAFWIQ